MNTDIYLNGRRFINYKGDILDTLFEKKATQTAVGYYKAKKYKIELFDDKRNIIACITEDNTLARADKLKNGRIWYSYGTPDLIGQYASVIKQDEDLVTAKQALKVKKRSK